MGDAAEYIKSGTGRRFSARRGGTRPGLGAGFILGHVPEGFDIYEGYPSLTERHQALAVIETCGRWIRYCPEIGWLTYDPEYGCWREKDAESAVTEVVGAFAHFREEKAADDREERAFAKSMLGNRGIRAVMGLMKTDPEICLGLEDFDTDPETVNCRGEVYNLRTGEHRPSEPEDHFLKSTGFRVSEKKDALGGAKLPEKFIKFLDEITSADGAPRSDLALYLMSWFGYALTGDTGAGFFMNFHGGGRNGKSLLLGLMMEIFGDYAAPIPEDLVIENVRAGGFDLSEIPGIRLGVVTDAPEGYLNMRQIKPIVSGDRITAKRKYLNNFKFTPICKIAMGSNPRLKLRETGVSAQRRIRMVPFDYTVPEGKENPWLRRELMKEAEEILFLLISYARKYYDNGGGPRAFPLCEVVERASREYLEGEDQVKQFLDEAVVREEGAETQANDLYRAYRDWTDKSGIRKPMGRNSFGARATVHLPDKAEREPGTFYLGVRLREAGPGYGKTPPGG